MAKLRVCHLFLQVSEVLDFTKPGSVFITVQLATIQVSATKLLVSMPSWREVQTCWALSFTPSQDYPRVQTILQKVNLVLEIACSFQLFSWLIKCTMIEGTTCWQRPYDHIKPAKTLLLVEWNSIDYETGPAHEGIWELWGIWGGAPHFQI